MPIETRPVQRAALLVIVTAADRDFSTTEVTALLAFKLVE